MGKYHIIQQISPKWLCLPLLSLFSSIPGFAQETQRNLSFQGNLVLLAPPSVSSPVLAPQGKAKYAFSEHLSIEAGIAGTVYHESFDTPLGGDSIPIELLWVDVGAATRLLRLTESLSVEATAGVGLTNFHRNSAIIPLGGFGQTVRPGSNEMRGNLYTGLEASQRLLGGLLLTAGSTIRFFTPISMAETGYTVFGGFAFEIL